MLGLSLTATVAARDVTIATLRAELSAANAIIHETDGRARRESERADHCAERMLQFVDRVLPPHATKGPVTQPPGVTETDAAFAKRFKAVPAESIR